jgi:hypothetical protein
MGTTPGWLFVTYLRERSGVGTETEDVYVVPTHPSVCVRVRGRTGSSVILIILRRERVTGVLRR